MTENELRNYYVNTAITYLGVTRGSAKHTEIVNLYNSIKPLPVGYTLKTTDDWCAGFVSAMAQKCKLTDIIYPECGCNRMITLYKNKGRWVENDAYVPKVGDIILYDWDDSGIGDNTNTPDHVGIVASISGRSFKVIEGNRGGKVAYRDMSVNGNNIRGFGVPDYASKGEAIKAENTAPKKHIIAVDGVWGNDTTRKTQEVFGCVVDGIRGKQTIKAIQKWCGATQDGILGKQTIKAIQKKLGVAVDGIMGKQTISAWQTWLNKQ